jgi:FKBP-type peptidyl-prolyl cis-trans isomerase FkpA
LGDLGLPAKLEHTIKIQFTGKLMASGNTFDYGTKEATLSSILPSGLQAGLAVLPEGTRATLYIPATLAYGAVGTGAVPPNANLIYEVEILDVTRPSSEVTQLTQDVQKVDQYLADSSITAVTDASGLRYVIHEQGSGAKPGWFDKVKIQYVGKLMSTGAEFYSGTLQPAEGFDSRVVDFIQAFQVGLQKLNKGGKATFYVPSGLAFGIKGTKDNKVPANANLIYEMELVDIIP